MSTSEFDPRLKAAMEEIREVCRNYDIAIQAMIVSPSHSEFAWHFPTWSVAQFEDGGEKGIGIRIRSKASDFPTTRGKEAADEATAHMLMQWIQWHEMCLHQTEALVKSVSEYWEIDHTPSSPNPHTEEGEAAAHDPRNKPLPRGERRRMEREIRKGGSDFR